MVKKKIIINIFLNTFYVNRDERLTREWINNRISVFMKYTFQSFKIQTNQDFTVFVQYEDISKDIVEEALEKYDKLPTNIQFVSRSTFEDRILENLKGYEDLYLVRIDSDDMYHKSFIEQLHDYKPKDNTQVLICQKGYIYDSVKNHLSTAIRRSSPPFYTFIYKTKDYVQGIRYKLIGGHSGAIKLHHEILRDPNYVIVVHSYNTSSSTRINRRFIDEIFDDENIGKTFNKYINREIIKDPTKAKKILAEFMG